jgi:hypothetical protein
MGIEQTSLNRRALLRRTATIAGAAIVLPPLVSLGGCTSAPATLADKMELISTISDRIIPATDTGGALVAKVPEYIAAVYEQHFTEEQQADFTAGLSAISDRLSDAGTPEEIDTVLAALDEDDDATWRSLREMTIFGYYTSETATEELAYEELPGRYDGCVPLEDVGSAWLARGV